MNTASAVRVAPKSFLLTFDVEEFDLLRELGRPLPPSREHEVTASGLARILPLLACHGVRATFFITARFAEAETGCVRAIVDGGHEAAVHGLTHADDYAHMEPGVAVDRLVHARQVLERISGQPAAGVRTPRLQPCRPEVLREAGFSYDASPHPTWVPGRYNGLRLPRTPWREHGMVCIPISVLPMVRVPVSWLWYRCAGPYVGRIMAAMAGYGAPYLHVYFHPWEALPLRAFGVPAALAVRTGDAFVHALDGLLAWSRQRLHPQTVGEFARRLDEDGVLTSRNQP
jgi:peptidoglycan/xylan/chitin deacetylase (PgdA/CDA1 family)